MAYNFILEAFPSCGAFNVASMSFEDLSRLTRWVQRAQLSYLCYEYFFFVHRNEDRFRKGVPGTANEYNTPMNFASLQRYVESFGVETAGIPESDYTLRVSETALARYLEVRDFVPHAFQSNYGERNTITALVAILNIESALSGIGAKPILAGAVVPDSLFKLVPALREAYRRNNPEVGSKPSRPSVPAIVTAPGYSTIAPFVRAPEPALTEFPSNRYNFQYAASTKQWTIVAFDEDVPLDLDSVSKGELESKTSQNGDSFVFTGVSTAESRTTVSANAPDTVSTQQVDNLLSQIRDSVLNQGVLPKPLVEALGQVALKVRATAEAKEMIQGIIEDYGADFVRQVLQSSRSESFVGYHRPA